MKNFICIAIWLSVTSLCVAQTKSKSEKQIVIGTIDSLFSETLNEQREIWVQLPENIEENKKYPIIYVLDGSELFYTATGLIKLLSRNNIPPSIIVGIVNTERTRDFTPTNVQFQRGRESKTSGGASQFIKFLDCELAPYLKNKYPAGDMSTIIGHSTGGLFVMYAYLEHPQVFDNYLAVDPSLWWDKEQLVTASKKLLTQDIYKNNQLYMAVANSNQIDTVKVRKMKSVPSEMLRANLKMHDHLVTHQASLDFHWDYFGEEDHGSIIIPGMHEGLRSIFKWYPFQEKWRFNTPDAYSAKELTQPFYDHYSNLSKRFKHEVKPDWQFINDVGFFILQSHKSPKKALAYLEMNLHFYPKEARTYAALGDYFVLEKKHKEAISNYKKALGLEDNVEIQKKLNKLN